MVRVAAAGDIHASEATRERVERAFSEVESHADLVLLAGDLTTTGEPDEGQVLADACADLSIPSSPCSATTTAMPAATRSSSSGSRRPGIHVLDGAAKPCVAGGIEVGIVGAKGFVGGFAGAMLPDFGEPLLREVYAETTRDAQAIADGLIHVVHCDIKIVLLHYAPIRETLAGEPEGIHVLLGQRAPGAPDRRARRGPRPPRTRARGLVRGPDRDDPVYNVAVHVMGRDFWIFDLEPARPRSRGCGRIAPPVRTR